MSTPCLIYLHGFNSTPQSKKATQLRDAMTARGFGEQFACPTLSHWPARAIETIEAAIARAGALSNDVPITLLGSSLGGFYATHLAEKHAVRAVLVNPAVYPERDLAKYLGPQQNLYSGERYELTPEHMTQLKALAVSSVHPERYWLVAETADEVLDYREAVNLYAGARQTVIEGGDHTLQSFPQHIDAILAFAGFVR
ncbi:MAG: YqiA/YcfP family alpha/beta fold hydrolase [Burkholderiales bacterium]